MDQVEFRGGFPVAESHFFPADLLDSQLAALQEPESDEHPLVVEIDQSPEAVVAAVLSRMPSASGNGTTAAGPDAERALRTQVPDEPPASTSATGASWHLVRGDQSTVVVELGAALRDYVVHGRPLLEGCPPGAPITGGRGQVLVPWPNRVGEGRYRFGGRTLQLPLNEAETGNAIHGLMRWVLWKPLDHTGDSVLLGTTLSRSRAIPSSSMSVPSTGWARKGSASASAPRTPVRSPRRTVWASTPISRSAPTSWTAPC